MYCGIGTHFVPSASINDLKKAFNNDIIDTFNDVESILQRFSKPVGGTSFPFLLLLSL